MKKSKILKVSMNEDTAMKLAYVAKSEGMSIQNEIAAMIRQKIAYFERVKGNIAPKNLADISLDAFEDA